MNICVLGLEVTNKTNGSRLAGVTRVGLERESKNSDALKGERNAKINADLDLRMDAK